MKNCIILNSNNIIIRESIFDDCKYFGKWEKKEYIKRFLSIDESRNYEDIIRDFILDKQEESKQLFTILYKWSMQPIGRIHLTRLDSQLQSVDITRIYIGEEDFLCKGYGREAMSLILNYCFGELKMERVTLDTFEGNKRADRLYASLGFVDEGTLRYGAKKNGKFYNLKLKSLLRHEYEQLQEAKQ